MSEKLPNMLESTIAKLREMVDVNSVVGSPITTPDGVTIIPISKISVGFGSVRILPISEPASTTADRVVDMVPDVLDKVSDFIDSHTKKE